MTQGLLNALVALAQAVLTPFYAMQGEPPPSVTLMIGVTYEARTAQCEHHHLGFCVNEACWYTPAQECTPEQLKPFDLP